MDAYLKLWLKINLRCYEFIKFNFLENLSKAMFFSLDLFHKSKSDQPLADYLYRKILNIHA